MYKMFIYICIKFERLTRWLSGKESACQCRRHRFNPRGGKIPWRRKWQTIPASTAGGVGSISARVSKIMLVSQSGETHIFK